MSDTAYEAVDDPPPDPVEAFTGQDTAALQAQAAVLLGVSWHLSAADGPIDSEVAEYLGLPEYSGTEVPGARVPMDEVEAAAREYAQPTPELTRSRLFDSYREAPNRQIAAALFRSSLNHSDPLVRTAAAAGYLEIGLEPQPALDILQVAVSSPDPLVQAVAETRAAAIAPELRRPELSLPDQYDGPSTSLESTLIIHGTWARKEDWWRLGSEFHTYLTSVCPDLYGAPDAYFWSGRLSHAARLRAAVALKAWLEDRNAGKVDLVTHSHGGSVAMLASWFPTAIGKLVLLSCPVDPTRYWPYPHAVDRAISIRVRCDLVLIADRSPQRFDNLAIEEHVLRAWFKHSATHSPDVWRRYDVPSMIA